MEGENTYHEANQETALDMDLLLETPPASVFMDSSSTEPAHAFSATGSESEQEICARYKIDAKDIVSVHALSDTDKQLNLDENKRYGLIMDRTKDKLIITTSKPKKTTPQVNPTSPPEDGDEGDLGHAISDPGDPFDPPAHAISATGERGSEQSLDEKLETFINQSKANIRRGRVNVTQEMVDKINANRPAGFEMDVETVQQLCDDSQECFLNSYFGQNILKEMAQEDSDEILELSVTQNDLIPSDSPATVDQANDEIPPKESLADRRGASHLKLDIPTISAFYKMDTLPSSIPDVEDEVELPQDLITRLMRSPRIPDITEFYAHLFLGKLKKEEINKQLEKYAEREYQDDPNSILLLYRKIFPAELDLLNKTLVMHRFHKSNKYGIYKKISDDEIKILFNWYGFQINKSKAILTYTPTPGEQLDFLHKVQQDLIPDEDLKPKMEFFFHKERQRNPFSFLLIKAKSEEKFYRQLAYKQLIHNNIEHE